MNFGKTFKVACSNNKEKNMQNMSLALIHRHGLKFLLNSPVPYRKKNLDNILLPSEPCYTFVLSFM